MKLTHIYEIVTDKVMLLNTSTFVVALSQVDMIIKMIFYIVSIFYTIFMLYNKIRETLRDRCGDMSNNPPSDTKPRT